MKRRHTQEELALVAALCKAGLGLTLLLAILSAAEHVPWAAVLAACCCVFLIQSYLWATKEREEKPPAPS